MKPIIIFTSIILSLWVLILPAQASSEKVYANRILLVVAMGIEARPIIKELNLKIVI